VGRASRIWDPDPFVERMSAHTMRHLTSSMLQRISLRQLQARSWANVIVACDAWLWRKIVMKRLLGSLSGMLLLAACAQNPMGPTVAVMPGPNTSFSQFQNDQAVCRNFADQAVRDQAQGANLRGLGTAALTTALGAGLGAAIGGGQGAGIGAAAGALGGTGLAARNTSNANTAIQAQYDNAFASCMFSLGNSVPATGPMMNR
jgi:outer membrane lipoprotein SlyB